MLHVFSSINEAIPAIRTILKIQFMRWFKVISVIGLVLIAAAGWWNFLDVRIRAALAEEQVRYFAEIVTQASQRKSAEEIMADMEAIRIYYPSGSKQRAGSHLDQIVERARSDAISRLEELERRLRTEVKPETGKQ